MTGVARSEKLATATFVVMCVAVSAAAVNHVIVSRSQPSAPARPQPLVAGTQLKLPESLTRDARSPRVLLVLSTACKYCTESMPFYARIAELPAIKAGRVQLAVVSLQSKPQMRMYLDEHRLAVTSIVTSMESGFSVAGTPTLVLTNAEGVVADSWSGLLPAEEEENVLAAIGQLVKTEVP
jgi:hypothetical protein